MKKRILIFNDSLTLGGTELLLVNLLNHLAEKDCEVTLLLPQASDENVLLKNVSLKISVKYIYSPSASYLRKKIGENLMIFCPRLFNKIKGIKKSDYDMLVCFKDSFYARLFSKMKLPKTLWIHNILYKRQYEARSLKEKLSIWLNKKQIKITQRSYNRYNTVVCVSETCRTAYLEVLHNGKKPNQDIRLLYNAIDLSLVVEKSKEGIIPLPQDLTTFILVARNSHDKRVDRLIRAAARLKQEDFTFRVYILGEGLNSPEMQNEIERIHLNDTIFSLGRIENPYPYILQSKWLLCTSERESFSLTLLEAMALGTPVITTNCGGPSDIVAQGKYGILVDNNSEGVYQGMKSVLSNPSLSVKYSSQLHESVKRFDYEKWLESIDNLLFK